MKITYGELILQLWKKSFYFYRDLYSQILEKTHLYNMIMMVNNTAVQFLSQQRVDQILKVNLVVVQLLEVLRDILEEWVAQGSFSGDSFSRVASQHFVK